MHGLLGGQEEGPYVPSTYEGVTGCKAGRDAGCLDRLHDFQGPLASLTDRDGGFRGRGLQVAGGKW